MWSPTWSELRAGRREALCALGVLGLLWLAACGSTPTRTAASAPGAAPPRGAAASAAGAANAPNPAAADGNVSEAASTPLTHPDVPPAARADFARAVNSMRAGNATEAELGFKQVALQYPQFAAPLVNLAILQRKDGHLEEAETTLKSAVAHESGSAVAWTELGITQRLRGEFKEAASSYERAIAADPHYAAAWRNLGVLSDLYLDDPNRALKAFEQYKQLTGEDKPVSGWIAELRQRLGMPPAKRPGSPEQAPAAPAAAPAGAPGAAPAKPQSQPQQGGNAANAAAAGG
jgi:tetratricopeptide (TPR) repeat protein